MANKNGPYVPQVTVKRYVVGAEARPGEFAEGDFILTHSNSLFGWLIRFGQTLRFWGRDRRFAYWNHAAMIVTPDGDIIEALGRGVVRGTLTKYKHTDYHLVHLNEAQVLPGDRSQAVAFAAWSLGEEYGWLTIFSIALSLTVGLKISFGFDGQAICSGLVARALERTNIIFDRTPSHITPADLAKYFAVVPDRTDGAQA